MLAAVLPPHIAVLLKNDGGGGLDPEVVRLIVKEMGSSKAGVRRAVLGVVGSVFWDLGLGLDLGSGGAGAGANTKKVGEFARAVFGGLEVCLKSAVGSGGGVGAGAGVGVGPLEGYVSVALLLGTFIGVGEFGAFPFPSFVLSFILTKKNFTSRRDL